MWSLGVEGGGSRGSPDTWAARLLITSLTFMFVCVPLPVWTLGN